MVKWCFIFSQRHKKSSYEFRNCFSWTSQGLNLGPPDYESVAKHDKSYGFIMCNQLSYKYFTSVCKPINKLS